MECFRLLDLQLFALGCRLFRSGRCQRWCQIAIRIFTVCICIVAFGLDTSYLTGRPAILPYVALCLDVTSSLAFQWSFVGNRELIRRQLLASPIFNDLSDSEKKSLRRHAISCILFFFAYALMHLHLLALHLYVNPQDTLHFVTHAMLYIFRFRSQKRSISSRIIVRTSIVTVSVRIGFAASMMYHLRHTFAICEWSEWQSFCSWCMCCPKRR